MKSEAPLQIKMIAEALNLSPTTVSFVLNGHGDAMRISKKTQKRVNDEAVKYHYRPNIYARRLRTGTDSIPPYVIAAYWNTDDYVDEMLGALVRSVQKFEKENQVSLELVVQPYSGGHLCDFQDSFTSNRYSGIIFFGMTQKDLQFMGEHRFNLPIVICNRQIEPYSCVLNSDVEAGRMCAEHFCKRGIRSVGILGVDPSRPSSLSRRNGFLEAAKKYGIEVKPEWLIQDPRRTTKGGYDTAMRVLQREDRPNALFIMYDTALAGVLDACRELRLSIPRDLEIVSYGDNVVLHFVSPSITSLSVPKSRPAEAAISILVREFNKETSEPEIVCCKPQFCYRESSPAPSVAPSAEGRD